MDINYMKSNATELSKDEWLYAAKGIESVAPIIKDILVKDHNADDEAAEQFMADMQLDYSAMVYVVNFARDKCRIIVLPDSEY